METTTLIFLFILVWGILGVTFLCIGIGLHVRERKKRNTCTLPVTATVVDLRRERVGVDDFSASGEAALKSWFPIYEYTAGGVTQRAKAVIGTAKPEVEVGQAVELFVNPDRIEEFYCPTEKASCIQKVFIGVGAVCLCLAVIMVGILWFVSESLVCIILQTSVGK